MTELLQLSKAADIHGRSAFLRLVFLVQRLYAGALASSVAPKVRRPLEKLLDSYHAPQQRAYDVFGSCPFGDHLATTIDQLPPRSHFERGHVHGRHFAQIE